MEGIEAEDIVTYDTINDNDSDSENVLIIRSKKKPRNGSGNTNSDSDSSDKNETLVTRPKRRIKQFSESNSDEESVPKITNASTDSDTDKVRTKTKTKLFQASTDSDSKEIESNKNEQQQLRMKNKRTKLREKFKSLMNKREKEKSKSDNECEEDIKRTSDDSDDDSTSIIKEKIKEKMSFIPSVCDPDTSSDEESKELEKVKLKASKQIKNRKTTQPTSPKPVRMTAKIAMENMQKIKSESNRMLREKQVSLPYHRPKALSLKDILNRRKPAISNNGKTLPIKMNEEQLKQYAQQLEQRQKEMMELCKSDSEEENETEEINLNSDKNGIETIENNDQKFDNNDKKINDKPSSETEVQTNEIVLVSDVNINKNEEAKEVENENITDINEQILTEKDDQISESYTELAESATFTEDIIPVNDNTKTESEKVASTELILEENEKDDNIEGTEKDSQLISLHFDTENNTENIASENLIKEGIDESKNDELFDDFFENDIDMINIEKIIDNAELKNGTDTKQYLNVPSLNVNPKLTGAPGMVIDLDDAEDSDLTAQKKLSGVELLKERFTYFAKLKTPEEKEREREKRTQPGALLKKLKQELEDEIAEQRSIEWAKRLQDEKNHEAELKALRGDTSDVEDEVEKIDKLAENVEQEESSSSEEDLVEDDIDITDKLKKKNAFVTDEAEESECDNDENGDQTLAANDDDDDENQEDDENETNGEESDDSSETSDEEQSNVVKKGRILKAFEDSDDEDVKETDVAVENDNAIKVHKDEENTTNPVKNNESKQSNELKSLGEEKTHRISDSQDDVIQLAQAHRSVSDEVFTSLESVLVASDKNKDDDDVDLYNTQTFSILKTNDELDKNCNNEDLSKSDTQSLHNFTNSTAKQGFGPSQIPNTQNTQDSSQPIGEDILALCTGNFYENEFISQNNVEETNKPQFVEDNDKDNLKSVELDDIDMDERNEIDKSDDTKQISTNNDDGNLLQSILDELHDPEFDAPKVNKYFPGNTQESIVKKKFVIDSDDEDNKTVNEVNKRRKKKKLEKRALQISDDEDSELETAEAEEYESEIEDDDEEDGVNEKVVEYDSEENEVEVKPHATKKKRKATEFFENEAELTSEDEWIGSGDEDEVGLDRMEREEGDDETFNQTKLQRELGQIHMRDVMDQDKREVRIIQELLFEDGDLGDGHRQRKFRWRNADDEEQMGTIVGDYADTQEEEFESEEQWRKQRHEREIFLKQMQNKDEAEDFNISIDRSTIIKANLCSKTMSTLLQEMKKTDTQKTENTEKSTTIEKKTTRDIPSPKKAFSIFQQNYHGSLLTRGNGALARLAALATPLATDDDATKIGSLVPTNGRNFVFASVTPHEEPKATKRKADTKPDTPRLIKKMKVTDKQKITKNSLLDHLKV